MRRGGVGSGEGGGRRWDEERREWMGWGVESKEREGGKEEGEEGAEEE